MPKVIDITGLKYKRLTAVSFSHKKGKKHHWLFKCDCGKETITAKGGVMEGATSSCGCWKIEANKLQKVNLKHGAAKRNNVDRLYGIWSRMRQRCRDVNIHEYARYGGRGISVDTEWNKDFLSFKKWALDNGYMATLTIDRINNDGNYEPSNCRWISRKEQNRNRSTNKMLRYNDLDMCIVEWAEKLNVTSSLIECRLRRGRSIGCALGYEPLLPKDEKCLSELKV